jgi:hypothetical protein
LSFCDPIVACDIYSWDASMVMCKESSSPVIGTYRPTPKSERLITVSASKPAVSLLSAAVRKAIEGSPEADGT